MQTQNPSQLKSNAQPATKHVARSSFNNVDELLKNGKSHSVKQRAETSNVLRDLRGAPTQARALSKPKKKNAASLLIGPQPHINRLKRFICDNLDKQNNELACKLHFNTHSSFSSNLKELVADRLA